MPQARDQNSSAPVAEGSSAAHASSSQIRKRSRDNFEEPWVEQPSQKKQRIEETELWTTVKKFLQDPENAASVPQVSCSICMEQIAIRGVPGQEASPYKLSNGQQKVGVVLPCAHIFCQECVRSHILSQAEEMESNLRTCPHCRHDLRLPGCGHLVPAKRLPVATFERFDMVPLTRPELVANGQAFTTTCGLCIQRRAQEYIDISLDFIGELIHGATQASDAKGWTRVDNAFSRAVSEYVGRTGPSWLHVDPSDLSLEVAFMHDKRLGQHAKKSPNDGQDLIVNVEQLEGRLTTAVWSVPLWRMRRRPRVAPRRSHGQ